MQTIQATKEKPGWTNGLLNNARIVCANSDSAKALDQTSGSSSWQNVFVSGGHGPFACGSQFSWTGGGIEKGVSVRKYGAGYYADLLRGLRLKSLVLQGLHFPAGSVRYETILRIMGVDFLLVNGGLYDGSKQQNKKEAWQIRHCRDGQFNQVEIYGSIVTGALKPGEASAVSLKAYHADAEKFRTKLKFFGCTIGGHVRVTGQSDVEFIGCTFTGPDPRGNSPKTCINLESFTTVNGKKLRPTATATGCKFPGWKVPAGAGVVIR